MSLLVAFVFLLVISALSPVGADPGGGSDESGNPYPHSAVVDWIDALLEAIEADAHGPTVTTWRLWVATSAMYDAWAAYDARAAGTVTGYALKRPARERTADARAVAVDHAAYLASSALFPGRVSSFTQVLERHGRTPAISPDPATPEGVALAAVEAVLEARLDDGANARNGFTEVTSAWYPQPYAPVNSPDPSAPNGIRGADFVVDRWQPLRVANGVMVDSDGHPVYDDDDPSTYGTQRFLTPHWGAVAPFALTSPDQFRAPPPPRPGSDAPYVDGAGRLTTNDAAWRAQLDELVRISAALTDEQKVIAEMWADGPHSWTPPGHWVQFAIGISLRDGHTLDEDVRMYMALSGALLDAGISAWESKRHYDYSRPVTAIRRHYAGSPLLSWAGPGRGTAVIDGSVWRPYQRATALTPPFPEYTSGHSTFSRAAREVLRSFAKSDRMYDGVTRLGRDYDGDGVEDYLGQHIAVPGSLGFDQGPSDTVVLRWRTLLDAADEAGYSRRYGGIHFQDGDLRARVAGREVGLQAYARATVLWDPFGETRRTVKRLGASGDISPEVTRELTVRLTEIASLMTADHEEGCNRLASVATDLEGRWHGDLTGTAATDVGQHLRIITEAFCTSATAPG